MTRPAYAFTLAKVADYGGRAAKQIVGKDDGSRETFAYGKVVRWYFSPKHVGSHEGMARLLSALALRPDVMLAAGHPRSGLDLRQPQLRRWADADATRNTLVDVRRAWLPIDVDGYAVPAPWGLAEHLADAARCVRDDALGESFAGVTCVAAATSSTGLAGEEAARLRLFFLLDAAHPIANLQRWARGAQIAGLPVDPAVCQAGQPIYTARPIFRGALSDPVPERLRAFVLAGQSECVTLDVHQYDRRATEIEQRVAYAGTRCGSDWRRLLDDTLGGPASFFLPLTRALGVAARSDDTEAIIMADVAALLSQRADAGRQKQYGNRWVRDTVQRRRHLRWQTSGRCAAYINLA